MMMSDRHQPKHYEDTAKDSCQYCRRPTTWQQIGNEKVCAHCGTRVYSPTLAIPTKVNTIERFTR